MTRLDRRSFLAGSLALAGAAALPATRPARAAVADLDFASALDAARAIRAGQVSSVELTRLTFERIDRFNPKLNAIVNVLRDAALARAREADQAPAKGTVWGPLHGVPITIKETFGIKGVRHTAGAPFLAQHIASEDAVVVERLRRAGAIILGNTNVPIMAGDWQSYNEIYGQTGNPWNLGLSPGGSSGGSAAALAAGLGHLSVGSDIGGSIRVPAHFCGIYGHKPTVGVVPLRGHIPPPPGPASPFLVELAVAGPMARSAADLAIGMKVMGGPDADQATAYRWSLPVARKNHLRDFRVGFVLDHPFCPVTPESKEVLSRAVDALRKAGVQLTEGWPDGIVFDREFYAYVYLLWMYFVGTSTDSEATLRARAAQLDRTSPPSRRARRPTPSPRSRSR